MSSCNWCDPVPPVAVPANVGPETAAFLDAGDFAGEFTPRPPETPLGGKATYDGRIVFANLPRSEVALVLPSDLKLASNTSATPDVHPVALIFGHQTDTAWILPNGSEPDVGLDYSELILLVPFVQKTGGTKWHNYVVRIYLDDLSALALGNLWFGLQKRRAEFTESASSFQVAEPTGASLFELSVTSAGSFVPSSTAETTLLNYTDMQQIFEMPVIGTHELGPPDQHICSYFEWHFDNVEVRPIKTKHKFVKAFAPGMESWVGVETPSLADGAFEIKGLRWLLRLPPLQCSY